MWHHSHWIIAAGLGGIDQQGSISRGSNGALSIETSALARFLIYDIPRTHAPHLCLSIGQKWELLGAFGVWLDVAYSVLALKSHRVSLPGMQDVHSAFGGGKAARKADYMDMVNNYYSLATDFYVRLPGTDAVP